MEYRTLYAKTVAELRRIARQDGIKIPVGASKMRIVELILEGTRALQNDRPANDMPPSESAGEPAPTTAKKRGRPRLSDEEKAERAEARKKEKTGSAKEQADSEKAKPNEGAPSAAENTPKAKKSVSKTQPKENSDARTPKTDPTSAEPVQTSFLSADDSSAPKGHKTAARSNSEKEIADQKTDSPSASAASKAQPKDDSQANSDKARPLSASISEKRVKPQNDSKANSDKTRLLSASVSKKQMKPQNDSKANSSKSARAPGELTDAVQKTKNPSRVSVGKKDPEKADGGAIASKEKKPASAKKAPLGELTNKNQPSAKKAPEAEQSARPADLEKMASLPDVSINNAPGAEIAFAAPLKSAASETEPLTAARSVSPTAMQAVAESSAPGETREMKDETATGAERQPTASDEAQKNKDETAAGAERQPTASGETREIKDETATKTKRQPTIFGETRETKGETAAEAERQPTVSGEAREGKGETAADAKRQSTIPGAAREGRAGRTALTPANAVQGIRPEPSANAANPGREPRVNPRMAARNGVSQENGAQSASGVPFRGYQRNPSAPDGIPQPTNGFPYAGNGRTDFAGRGFLRGSQPYDANAQSALPLPFGGNARRNPSDGGFQPGNANYNGGRGFVRGASLGDAETQNRFAPRDTSRAEAVNDAPDDSRAAEAGASKAESADAGQQNAALNDLLQNPDCPDGAGVLEIQQEGYGFLRAENFLPGPKDIYVSIAQIRRFGLRNGDYVEGKTRAQREGDRYVAMLYINAVNGRSPEEVYRRPRFEDLTPIYPDSRLRLEKKEGGTDLALRAIDLVAPIGKGQRGLIVSPPKAGKTVLLKKIANAVTENYPDIHLIVLLIDERPEEVTDLQRSIRGEVVYSTFDEMPDNHTRLSEMTLDRAQRLVEGGRDVVILLDSITRLARAYNLVIPPTGRSLSGGLDPGALHKPKRFFGAARNIENGGSLTIIATALVETGSRMDDIIYEEFKGTGNMELHLDRKLSEKRIFPAVDLDRSGTRRDELLYDEGEAAGAMEMRRLLASNGSQDNTEQFIELMEKTRTNAEFLSRMKGWVAVWQKEGFM